MTGLLKIIQNRFSSHYSILIMVSGAGFFFIANILLKEILSSEEYSLYSLLIICLTLLNSFGLLGFEQVFMRIAKIDMPNIIKIEKSILHFVLSSAVITALISSYLANAYYFSDISVIRLSVLFFLTSANMFVYNIFRLNSDFVLAQFAGISWKIVIGIMAIFIFELKIDIEFMQILNVVNIALVCTFLISIGIIMYRIKFISIGKYSKGYLLNIGFGFFISLLSISLLGQGDKIILERIYGKNSLGDYFFLANIFMFPFTFLQSYAGFKELVIFKKRSNINLNRRILKWLLVGVAMAVCLEGFYWLIKQLGLADIDLEDTPFIILSLILTGFIRIIYGILSAFMGANANPRIIHKANIYSIISIVICIGLIFILPHKLISILIVFFLAWLSRVLIWNYNLKGLNN